MKKMIGLLLSCLLICGCQEWAAQAQEKTRTNSIVMEMVLIPAGSFIMGGDLTFEECNSWEMPQHRVSISQPFYLGKHEVTQAQWAEVMGSNPSKFKGRSNPVEQVSWDDVQAFIRKLNLKEGMTGYRLPTEAEWEYAARAGTSETYSFGDDEDELSRYAWFDEDWNTGSTHPVGQKQPNAWGLHDVHGNVREWVEDWFGENYYANSPGTDPKGPSGGSIRVLRGGSWYDSAGSCRSAARYGSSPGDRFEYSGFRLVFSPGQ
jgi:formylglycine-generating enzyme required for sulfatase activity